MHRLSARLLLLLTLVGTLAPILLAASTPPAHACCVRKTRQCHDMKMPGMSLDGMPEQPGSGTAIHTAGCDQQGCCRAMVVGSWATPRLSFLGELSSNVDVVAAEAHPNFVSSGAQTAGSVRAPPAA